MSTFVLIHGAWHGAWCWDEVVPLLEKAGHRAVAPDLPGHGDDATPLDEVTLDAYARKVEEVVLAQNEPVILVGHSMGGMAITQAAEQCPDRIKALVYLCAFLPANGESLVHWAEQCQDGLVHKNMVIAEDQRSAVVRNDVIVDAFYGDCTPEIAARAKARLQPQAVAPIVEPVRISDGRFGSVRRHYIECRQDRAIPLAIQRTMQHAQPCQSVVTLDAGHSPFLSAPESLVIHLSSFDTIKESLHA